MKQKKEQTIEVVIDVCDKCGEQVMPLSMTGETDKTKYGTVYGELAYHWNCICDLDNKPAIIEEKPEAPVAEEVLAEV